MYDEPSMINACPACGADSMRMLSAPRPQYVEQCRSCRSVFFYFGAAGTVSHNEQYNVDSNYQRYLESANECSVSLRYQETLKRVREMAPLSPARGSLTWVLAVAIFSRSREPTVSM